MGAASKSGVALRLPPHSQNAIARWTPRGGVPTLRPDDQRAGVSSIADIFESAQAAAAPAQEAEVFLRCDRGSALLLFLFFPVRCSRGAAALVSGEFSRRALAIGRRVRRWHSPRDRAAGLDHPAW